jgi:hypothetical protein
MALFFYHFLILFSFFTVPFLMMFNFYIIKKTTLHKLFATHHKSARDPPVWETLLYGNVHDTSHLIHYLLRAVIMINLLVYNTHLLQGCRH